MRNFHLTLLLIVVSLFCSCKSSTQNVVESDNEAMLKVAYQFLNVVKTNDTAKVKAMLFYGLIKSSNEIFAHDVNSASNAISKYGLPKTEKVSFDNSLHNEPLTTCVVFPLYNASNSNDEMQKAVIKVFEQKVLNQYEVVSFINDFDYKMEPLKP